MIDLKAFAEQYGGAQHPENEIRKEFDTLCQELRKLAEVLEFYGSEAGWSVADCSSEGEPGLKAREVLTEFSKAVKL